MAKGSEAKEKVAQIIAKAFGIDFLGEVDKKLYVLAPEGGEKIQIAISLTCPKTPIGFADAEDKSDWDWSTGPANQASPQGIQRQSVELTQEEKDNIANLMERLGL